MLLIKKVILDILHSSKKAWNVYISNSQRKWHFKMFWRIGGVETVSTCPFRNKNTPTLHERIVRSYFEGHKKPRYLFNFKLRQNTSNYGISRHILQQVLQITSKYDILRYDNTSFYVNLR